MGSTYRTRSHLKRLQAASGTRDLRPKAADLLIRHHPRPGCSSPSPTRCRLLPVMVLAGMERDFIIRPARGAGDLGAVALLMAEYAASLPVDLAYQDFASELAGLPGKYAPPEGELFLASDRAGAPLGCVALRPLPSPDRRCEMKRLFLRPAARGLGLGRALMAQVIEAARANGYRELCLDTLPTMVSAISLYEAAGFRRVDPYYAPTPPGTVFLGLAL